MPYYEPFVLGVGGGLQFVDWWARQGKAGNRGSGAVQAVANLVYGHRILCFRHEKCLDAVCLVALNRRF